MPHWIALVAIVVASWLVVAVVGGWLVGRGLRAFDERGRLSERGLETDDAASRDLRRAA